VTAGRLALEAEELERHATDGRSWERAAEAWIEVRDEQRSSRAWARAAEAFAKEGENLSDPSWYLRHAAEAWQHAGESAKATALWNTLKDRSEKSEDWAAAAEAAELAGDLEAAARRWEWAGDDMLGKPVRDEPTEVGRSAHPAALVSAATAWDKLKIWPKAAFAWERAAESVGVRNEDSLSIRRSLKDRAELWAHAAASWENFAKSGREDSWSLAARAWKRTANTWENAHFWSEAIAALEKEGAAWNLARCPGNGTVALERASAWRRAQSIRAAAEQRTDPPHRSRRY
jgi:hypothetical protein